MGESALVPLRFSVDQRTNSIIVSGNPGDLEVVRNVLFRLDASDLIQRITTVYRLHNAPAADVATAINNLLTRQRNLNNAAPELITAYQQIEREVLIEPETVTNSLIVSATPRYFEEIKQIVTELDRRPPMVVIQVLIAEVTLNDDDQFGVEWGLQDSLLFDRGIVGGPRYNWLGAQPWQRQLGRFAGHAHRARRPGDLESLARPGRRCAGLRRHGACRPAANRSTCWCGPWNNRAGLRSSAARRCKRSTIRRPT